MHVHNDHQSLHAADRRSATRRPRQPRHAAAVLMFAVVALIGCGGGLAPAGGKGGAGGGSSAGGRGGTGGSGGAAGTCSADPLGTPAGIPTEHRAVAKPCAPSSAATLDQCLTDADCAN